MNTLLFDLRFAVRMLSRQRGFTVVAILTLALGIGAATTIFTIVSAVLLKPLPYPDSERLVVLSTVPERTGIPITVSTPGDFLDWQAQSTSFEQIAAFTITPINLTDGGEPVRLNAAMVSPGFAAVVGVQTLVGQAVSSVASGDAQTALISAALWRERFASNPDIIGRVIHLDGAAYTVGGVMPTGFSFPADVMRGTTRVPRVDLWLPVALRAGARSNAFLTVAARLKAGVTPERAALEMMAVQRAIGERVPEARNVAVRVTPLQEQMVGDARPILLTLFGAVGLLLAIACANVANLLLGRASAREREAAIRTALGASRGRLLRQHLTESLLLGLAGGAAGVMASLWGLDLVMSLVPQGALPRLVEVAIDWRVLAFSVALSLVTGLVFGIVPAIHASRTHAAATLKASGSAQSVRTRWLSALVVSQVALAFVLTTSAGLLIRSFLRLTAVDPGFRADRVLTLGVTLPDRSYGGLPEERRFAEAVLERIHATPGVAEAGAVNLLPIGGSMLTGDFTVEGVERPRGYVVVKPSVSPGYFSAIGMPLLRGRDFAGSDVADAPGVVVVTDSFARRMWPGDDGIGHRLKLGFGPPEQDPWVTVVGVVGDIRQRALAEAPRPAIYAPIAQAPRSFLLRELSFVARASGDPAALAVSMHRAVRGVDAQLPIGRIATMSGLLEDSVSEPRFRAALLGAFAASALVLIAIGMLGVLGYVVARRTREIGVRMALGAHRVDVVGLVVRQASKMVLLGLAIGGPLAYAASRLLARFLFEISPLDPGVFAGAAAVLAALGLAASYLPARRATAVDPLAALRAD